MNDNLGKTLWNIADQLRGVMEADEFRDYMLSFLFLRYLSEQYEQAAKKELGKDYPVVDSSCSPLNVWYENNKDDIKEFEKQMIKKIHYVINPKYLWKTLVEKARTQDKGLLKTLEEGFRDIENNAFEQTYKGLFSEVKLNSKKLGKSSSNRNEKLCEILQTIETDLTDFSTDTDLLGDAYEYLIGQFAAGSGKKAGEFYTPQQLSNILSELVILDNQDPKTGSRAKLERILDFACGSGSLLINVKKHIKKTGKIVGKVYGQESISTTYNLARMNMILHGMKSSEFDIFHGDTLKNDWDILNEKDPRKKVNFDAVVANPPFSQKWNASDELKNDFRFSGYGVAPKSAADFAFLLHGFHFLKEEGTMAIILPHGVLFRGGEEGKIRKKLLKDKNIDSVIGLPSKLFYSTGIPVCIIVLKKCKKNEDVFVINASECYRKEKRQNVLGDEHINRIVEAYKNRKDEDRFSRCVPISEIEKNDYNLNISRYVSIEEDEIPIDLDDVHVRLVSLEKTIKEKTLEHNLFLKELGVKEL